MGTRGEHDGREDEQEEEEEKNERKLFINKKQKKTQRRKEMAALLKWVGQPMSRFLAKKEPKTRQDSDEFCILFTTDARGVLRQQTGQLGTTAGPISLLF